ncbi:velvet factor-domain-containing protein, partial [Scleroderma citrinum]
MDAVGTSYSAITTGYPYNRDRAFHDRDRLEYELKVRQEPKQARMCGVGSDRRPIDPPPIIQLRVIDKRTRQPPAHPDADDTDPTYAHSFLQNPYYFMFASLAKPDDDAELHWLKDGKTRCTTGSVVSSLYHLKDTENRNEDAGFFVFPDLSVRTEGSYRLKLSLFEVVGNTVRHCKSIYSAPFYVYTAKKFPGMEESTPLSCSLADQGIKIRIRKDIRVRKRPIAALTHPIEGEKAEDDRDDDHPSHVPPPNGSIGKRARHGPNIVMNANTHGDIPTPTSASSIALAGLPAWPTTALDPMLGVASAPGGIELPSPTHSGPTSAGPPGSTIPPPPGATYESAKAPPATIPPPPGAHIMTPQTGGYDGSRPSAPQHPVYDAPGQRICYEGNRSFDQAQARGYESTRTGYDHTAAQRGSYDTTNTRSSYDSQTQRSFGQSYDTPTQTYSDGHHGQPHPHTPYHHPQASYSGSPQQQQTQQSHPSPTHAYPPQASPSSQQQQQQSTHDSPYPPPPPPTSRFQSQYGTPPIHNYGQPTAYTQTHQGRYDYSQQQYGGGGATAYYDSPQS